MKRSQAQTLGTSGATFLRYFCLQTYFFAYILRITYIFQLHVWKILLFAHFGSRETSTVPTDSRLNLPWNAFTCCTCCTSFFSTAFSHKKAISNIFISSFTALRDIEHSVSPVIGSCFLCGRFYALQGKRSQSEHVQAFFIWTFIYIYLHLSPRMSELMTDVEYNDDTIGWLKVSRVKGLPESTCTLNFQLTIFLLKVFLTIYIFLHPEHIK